MFVKFCVLNIKNNVREIKRLSINFRLLQYLGNKKGYMKMNPKIPTCAINPVMPSEADGSES
jgi:hypothetical protein